jgi:hypothetical protein
VGAKAARGLHEESGGAEVKLRKGTFRLDDGRVRKIPVEWALGMEHA